MTQKSVVSDYLIRAKKYADQSEILYRDPHGTDALVLSVAQISQAYSQLAMAEMQYLTMLKDSNTEDSGIPFVGDTKIY